MTSYAAKSLRRTTRVLVQVQASLVLAAAAVYLGSKGWQFALAAGFGGAIALLNTLISARQLERSAEWGSDPRRGMVELYVGFIVRFVGAPALMGVGIVVFGLDPLAIIVGFAVAQLGYFLARARPS